MKLKELAKKAKNFLKRKKTEFVDELLGISAEKRALNTDTFKNYEKNFPSQAKKYRETLKKYK